MALNPYDVVQRHSELSPVLYEIVRLSQEKLVAFQRDLATYHAMRLKGQTKHPEFLRCRLRMEDALKELQHLAALGSEKADAYYTW